MRKFKLLCTLLLAILCGSTMFSQDLSNKGKNFWIPYPEHIDGTNSAMGLYITSDVSTTGVITVGAFNIPFTVTANTVTRKFIGPNANGDAPNTNVHLGNLQDGIGTMKAIHITSVKPVVVFAHIIRSARSGATLVLPTKVWGKEYILPSFGNTGASASFGELNIIASKPNTQVEIITRAASRNGSHTPGVPFTITIPNVGDIYQLQFQQNADLSGTSVKSIASASSGCNPIAVFSATTWSGFPCTNASGGDNLYQQLFPVGAWGKQFVTGPLKKTNTNPFDLNIDYVRVFVKDITTVVNKTENGITAPLAGLIIPGNYYQYTTTSPTFIQADKPVQVVQYITSQTCGVPQTPSDPEMIVLSAIEQTINDITVFSAHQSFVPINQSQVQTHYLNVIMKSNNTGSFKINGVAPNSTFAAIPATNYSYLKEDLTVRAATNPVFNLTADSGFSAIAYGFGDVESYGYNAGTNVKDLYTNLGFATLYGNASSPAACIGTGTRFKISLPYQPDSILWEISQLPGVPADTTTHYPPSTYDSIRFVNGVPIYWYSLPRYYQFNTAGTFPVTITTFAPNSDGCGSEQEYTFDVEVYPKPIADFNFTTDGCVTNPVQFTDNSNTSNRPVFSRYWNFGDANTSTINNPSHTYAAAGSYNVKYTLVTDIGCLADTMAHIVNLSDPPVANFTTAGPYCEGNTIAFTDNSTAGVTKWVWDFGDGSPIVTINAPTNPNVTHTYASANTYTVSLTVTTGGCVSVPHTFNVTIHPKPISNFSFPNVVCLPSGATQFTDLSTVGGGNTIAGWLWNFGDGSPTSGLQNPLHIYTGTGPYNVMLTVTSNNSCTDIKQLSINTIYAQPQAAFNSLPSVCIGSLIGFSDASTAPGSTITGWTWNFGDGSPTSPLQNPSHTYAAAGTYTVTLTVTSAVGCQSVTNIASHNVTVSPLPTAGISGSTTVCLNAPMPNVVFSGLGGTPPYTFVYNINGGPNLTIQTITGSAISLPVPTNVANTFTYNLVSVQEGGSSACAQNQGGSAIFIVKALPTATITGNTDVCLNAPFPNVTFTGADGAAPYTFTYTINGGAPQNVTTVSGNSVTVAVPTGVANAFTYTLVSVREGSTNLCSQPQSGSVIVNVKALPTASISGNAAEVCLNAPSPNITFTGASGTAPYTFTYTINGGAPQTVTTSTGNSVTVAVLTTVANTFIYTLVSVQESSGTACTQLQSGSTTVKVNPLPTSDFNFSAPSCATRTITFTDASVPNAGALNSWTWNFGDGSPTSSLQNPTHTFATANTYNVTLTVSTDKGCVSTVLTKPVVINARPAAGFVTPEVCVSDNAAPFTDQSTIATGTVTAWEWNFGDPNATPGNPNTSTLQNPTHGYSVPGPYTVTLVAISNNGCRDTIQHTFTVNGAILTPDFNVQNATTLCSNKPMSITDASVINAGVIIRTEIYWDFLNDPTIKSVINNPVTGATYTHTYPEFGTPFTKTYQVRYVVYSGINCINTKIKTVTVLATPSLQFNAVPEVCSDAVSFQITQAQLINGLPGGPGVFSGPGVTSGGLFSPPAAGAGQHTIRYTYTGTNGCINYIERILTVNPTPTANAGPDKVVLEGGQVALTPAVNAGFPLTYLWTPPTGLSNPNVPQPNASPIDDITYTLTVTSDKGCWSSDQVFVKVLKAPAIPNIFSPNGDGVHDTWTIQFLDTYPGCTVDIYNRYGQVLFHSVGYTVPWDGKVNGKPVPVGTYYYIVNPKNGRSQMSGYVDVIR